MEMIVFQILVLLFSVVIHEVSHGYMAERLGDDTARKMGRLTLNPIKHLDPIGSVLVPVVLASLGGIVFGWAKPVIYNPRNLKNPERDSAFIALAGPSSNIAIALLFGVLFRILAASNIVLANTATITTLFFFIIQINIALAVFNLIPIPPLDGSKILFPLLPQSAERLRVFLERYGFLILLAFIFFGFDFLFPIMEFLFRIITGT